MYNELALNLTLLMGLVVGAMIGATIYHLIVYKFSNDVEKQLKKTIKNYEDFLIEKVNDSVKEFDLLKSSFVSISNDITEEQKDIYESTHDIAENLNFFFKELNSSQKIRVNLENEITKLKNINNRLTKKLREKEDGLPI